MDCDADFHQLRLKINVIFLIQHVHVCNIKLHL